MRFLSTPILEHRQVHSMANLIGKLSQLASICRLRAREGHLGVSRQVAEMLALRMLHGVGPNYYHTAGFFRRELDWSDKISQLSHKEYRRRVAILNPVHYRKISQNKVPEKAILTLFDIPTARFLGRLNAHTGVDAESQPLRTAVDLERLARKHNAARLVFKPLEGWGGKGIHIPDVCLNDSLTFRESGDAQVRDAESYCRDTLNLDKGGSTRCAIAIPPIYGW